jgi:hypothetical protein
MTKKVSKNENPQEFGIDDILAEWQKEQENEEKYHIGTPGKASVDFRKAFNTSLHPFYDGLATIAFGKICIDPFLFDDWLHRKHGDYEESGQTMEDVVRENYSEEALRILNRLL